MMTRSSALCVLLTLCFLVACGGGTNTVRDADPAIPALRALSKGAAWYQKGCYNESLPYLLRAHERFTALDDLTGIAMSMNNIGNVYRKIGDSRSAILFFESAYAIYTDIDDRNGAVQALANQSAVLIQENHLTEAEDLLKTARDIAKESGGANVSLLYNRAVLLMRKRDHTGAGILLRQALEACDPQNPAQFATVSFSLGKLMKETGQYDSALQYFQQALSADRKSQSHDGIAGDLAAIGSVYIMQDDPAAAADYYQRSVKIYALLENKPKVIETMALLEESAAAGNVDITVTRHFVNKWSRGEMLDVICR